MSAGHAATADSSLLGQSPVGWRVDRIRDHLSGIVGGEWGDDPDAHDDGIELPVIRVADIRDLDLTVNGLTIRRIKESKLTGRLIGKQTILLEKSGGGENKPVGRAVRTNRVTFDAICSNFMAKVDCCDTVAPEFVVYMLDALYSSGVNGACIQQTTGIQNLRVLDYLNTKVAFPPLHEQLNIAAYLDASCAAIDAAVSAKRRQLDTLEALRKSIIQRAVTFGIEANPKLRQVNSDWIREVPSHWDVCRVKRVVARMDYGIGVSTGDEGRYPVLKMGNVQDGEIQFAKLDFIDEVDDNLILERGDLLYNRTNSPDQVGKAAIFRKSRADAITFASYLVRLRVNHRVNAWYLNYVLNTSGFLAFARRLAVPSVQQSNLNSTRYAQMFIPLPPIEEQKAILSFLNEKTAAVDTVVATIQTQIETLTAYRKSLIHECVTGQRRVTEADVAAIA